MSLGHLRSEWKKEMENEIYHKFRKFLAFSEFFWHFFAKYRDTLSFPEHLCEIPAIFFFFERTPRLETPRDGSPPALSSSSVGSEKIYFDEENAVSSV